MNRSTLVVFATVGVIGGVGLIGYFRDSEGDARMLAELRREAEWLDRELAADGGADVGQRDTGKLVVAEGPAEQPVAGVLAELAAHMEVLMAAVTRLEAVARQLEQRITQSQLSYPRREEVKAKLDTMRGDLDVLRERVNTEYTEAARIVGQTNPKLTFDFLDPGQNTPSPLAANPNFVAAREKLLDSQRMLNAFEQYYQAGIFTFKLTKTSMADQAPKILPPLPARSILGADPADVRLPIEYLSASIARLEIVVEKLAERLAGAQSVLPTMEEKWARLTRMRTALDDCRKDFEQSVEEARRWAAQVNVAVEEKQLTGDNEPLSPALASHAQFLTARKKVALQYQLYMAAKQNYAATDFEWRGR